jgi:hypothetical protein
MYNDIHYRHNIIEHFLFNAVIFMDYVRSKENIMNLLTESLIREFGYILLRRKHSKPLKMKTM